MVLQQGELVAEPAARRIDDERCPVLRRRAAAYRAYWEHMPFPKSARPVMIMNLTDRGPLGYTRRVLAGLA